MAWEKEKLWSFLVSEDVNATYNVNFTIVDIAGLILRSDGNYYYSKVKKHNTNIIHFTIIKEISPIFSWLLVAF